MHRSSKWQGCFKIKIIFFLRFSMCYLKRCVAPSNRWQLSYSLREFPEEEPGKTLLVELSSFMGKGGEVVRNGSENLKIVIFLSI